MGELHTNLKLEVPCGARQVVLHTCCAPCAASIIECLTERGIEPVIFFCNPNIFPAEEYEKRKREIVLLARRLGLRTVDDDYSHDEWREYVKGLENEPERGKRCLECFRYRLRRTAQWCRENGFEVFTTTLASSRWKPLDLINEAGLCAASETPGTVFWPQNWRKGGLTERRAALIKENGFYNQTYCGCEFSMHPLNLS